MQYFINTSIASTVSFIIYCLNCIRRDRNSTYKTGLKPVFQQRIFSREATFFFVGTILPRRADVISDTDKGKSSLRAKKLASGKSALRRFSASETTLFLCRYHLLRQQDVAKWMPTKKKGRLA